jgi:hypothetical protein
MSSQTFPDVTLDMLERIARREDAAGFAMQIDEDRRAGTAGGSTPLGPVEVRFALAPDTAELSVTILRKPPFLPAAMLWAEFGRALEAARAQAAGPLAVDMAG